MELAVAHRHCKDDLLMSCLYGGAAYRGSAASAKILRSRNPVKALFSYLGRKADRHTTGRMKQGGWLILFRPVDGSDREGCPGLRGKVADSRIGIIFRKISGNEDPTLDFKQFVEALELFAEKRYPKLETLRRLTGMKAKMLQMFDEHILGLDEEVEEEVALSQEEVVPEEEEEGQNIRSNKAVATETLTKTKSHHPRWAKSFADDWEWLTNDKMRRMAHRIQGRARKNKYLNLRQLALDAKEIKRIQDIEHATATRLQTQWRMRLARRRLNKRGLNFYEKYIDAGTKKPYWYNPRTEKSTWDKPPILGENDITVSTRLPSKGLEFAVVCSHCNYSAATLACIECEDAFCEDCHKSIHRKGKRQQHKSIKINICQDCEYQAATSFVMPLARNLCDCCFDNAS